MAPELTTGDSMGESMDRPIGCHEEGTLRPTTMESKSVPGRPARAGAFYEVAEL
jgi:hypothetical protein